MFRTQALWDIELLMLDIDTDLPDVDAKPTQPTDLVLGKVVDKDLKKLWCVCKKLEFDAWLIIVELMTISRTSPVDNARRISKIRNLLNRAAIAEMLFWDEACIRYRLIPDRDRVLRSDWNIVDNYEPSTIVRKDRSSSKSRKD